MRDLIKFVQTIIGHIMLCMSEFGEVPRLHHVDQIISSYATTNWMFQYVEN